jgi:hypothetical protein
MVAASKTIAVRNSTEDLSDEVTYGAVRLINPL